MAEYKCDGTYGSSFRRGLLLVEQNIDEERRAVDESELWFGYYNSDAAAYDREFAALDTDPIGDFLSAKKVKTGAAYAMDVMGSLDFSVVAPVDGQAHMTLVKKLPERKNEVVFYDNAVEFKPWIEAHDYIREEDKREHPGFDLITSRPLNSWSGIADILVPVEHRHLLAASIVQREVRLLNPEGRLRQQLPFFFDYRSWGDDLNTVPGISAQAAIFESQKGFHRTVIEIERHEPGRIQIPAPRNVAKFPKPRGIVNQSTGDRALMLP